MTRTQRALRSIVLAAVLIAATTASASAATFYVNQRNGEKSPNCGRFPGGHAASKEDPCPTIVEAIEKTEGTAPPNTIFVNGEEGPYNESLSLITVRDKALTIAGEEGGAIVKGHVTVKAPASGITLSNLEVNVVGGQAAVADSGGTVALVNDTVVAESVERGVEANGGALTVEGGSVTLESATGFAVFDSGGPLTVSGTKIVNGAGGIGSESGGIASGGGSMTVANAHVINEGSAKETQFGIVAEGDSSAVVRNTTVSQGSPAIGVLFENAPPVVEGLHVEMIDPASKTEAVLSEGLPAASASFSHLETSGTWAGPALEVFGGSATVSDSRLATNLLAGAGAVRYAAQGATPGLVVHRSVIQSARKAAPASLTVLGGNATIDSSEILGGAIGALLESTEGGFRTMTIAASTVGPTPGISAEAPGVVGVEAKASGKGSTANVAIEGSIFIESQLATAALGDTATVTCAYSAVPSQVQTPNPVAHTGEISCPAGTSANTNSSGELAALFAEPLGNFGLRTSASAIDSVPPAAVGLPFGVVPSGTDLLGNPRVVDGNGDCLAAQDKGALELQGHAAACPPSPVTGATPKPSAPAVTALAISPSAFHAAPKGATISTAPRRKYGAKLTWRDSAAASSTFTVVRLTGGRRQGKSCRNPSRSNRHGRRCTLRVAVGTFGHLDKAGADSAHFSGRLRGRKLAPGSYQLIVAARNAAGTGAAVSRAFKIV
jgi:hypothetical protein